MPGKRGAAWRGR
jgi:uncharacterized protein (DUF3084 family)